ASSHPQTDPRGHSDERGYVERRIKRMRGSPRSPRRDRLRFPEAAVTPAGMISPTRWATAGMAVIASCGLLGCAAHRDPPPMPALPEVRYVPPCDPDATIALTASGQQALVERDQALRSYLAELEAILRGN